MKADYWLKLLEGFPLLEWKDTSKTHTRTAKIYLKLKIQFY